eukprot:766745-Hanusia_phi.AAC.4
MVSSTWIGKDYTDASLLLPPHKSPIQWLSQGIKQRRRFFDKVSLREAGINQFTTSPNTSATCNFVIFEQGEPNLLVGLPQESTKWKIVVLSKLKIKGSRRSLKVDLTCSFILCHTLQLPEMDTNNCRASERSPTE